MNNPTAAPIELKSVTSNKTSTSDRAIENYRTMKILDSTALTLEKLSEQINGSGPKRVQWKDIVDCAVAKIVPADLKKLREKKLTAADRFEEMYASYKSKNPLGSREQFYEELMKKVNPKDFESNS